MLTVFPQNTLAGNAGPDAGTGTGAIWYDLCAPTAGEIAEVEGRTGVRLPRREEMGEIERSSRLQARDGVLVLSMPTATPRTLESPDGAPLGFLLARDWLVTLRFGPLPAFDTAHRRLEAAGVGAVAGTGAEMESAPQDGNATALFGELCDDIVAHVADSLEHTAAELGSLSVTTFRDDDGEAKHAVRAGHLLRTQLRQVGRLNNRLTAVRDALQGLDRVLAFVEQKRCGADAGAEAQAVGEKLGSLRQDLTSLLDVGEHLTAKVQFILDAQVGLIGIAQNDIFKVLTIVSIIGIVPTLIAGIYGMNFEHMPEYHWRLGYPFALGLMVASVVLPLAWFKKKDWF